MRKAGWKGYADFKRFVYFSLPPVAVRANTCTPLPLRQCQCSQPLWKMHLQDPWISCQVTVEPVSCSENPDDKKIEPARWDIDYTSITEILSTWNLLLGT